MEVELPLKKSGYGPVLDATVSSKWSAGYVPSIFTNFTAQVVLFDCCYFCYIVLIIIIYSFHFLTASMTVVL